MSSVKVKIKNLDPSDYEVGQEVCPSFCFNFYLCKKVGPSFTKEFSLIGEENKLEKLRVKEKSSLFNKNFKVNKTTYIYL